MISGKHVHELFWPTQYGVPFVNNIEIYPHMQLSVNPYNVFHRVALSADISCAIRLSTNIDDMYQYISIQSLKNLFPASNVCAGTKPATSLMRIVISVNDFPRLFPPLALQWQRSRDQSWAYGCKWISTYPQVLSCRYL